MWRAPGGGAGVPTPAAGLRALAAAVTGELRRQADALGGSLGELASSLATGLASGLAGPQLALSLANDTAPTQVAPVLPGAATAPRPARHLPGRHPRPTPAPVLDPPAADDPGPAGAEVGAGGEDGDEGGISAEHTETWRLVARAQQGDGEAFGELYDRYVDMVYKFIYFRVNDRALAEDFTSETFLRALRRITTISYQGRDIGAWFVTIARNIVLDHVKSARTRLEITTADTLEGDDRAPSTESAVIDLLTSERLMAAVRQLGDEQRECVMLRFIQGLSVAETAAVMGKNDGAIKALQHRAVRKLAELVGSELR